MPRVNTCFPDTNKVSKVNETALFVQLAPGLTSDRQRPTISCLSVGSYLTQVTKCTLTSEKDKHHFPPDLALDIIKLSSLYLTTQHFCLIRGRGSQDKVLQQSTAVSP